MKLNGLVYLSQLILLLGTTLLLLFIVLSGGVDHFPFNKYYWLEADTSGIENAPDLSRWTFWGLARVVDGKNVEETSGPAYPFSPVDNFGTYDNIPQDFIDSRDTYFYLSRFAFAFYWVALAFVGVGLFTAIFSIFSATAVKFDTWLVTLGLFFTAGATSFETAVSVLGRSAFRDDGRHASLGTSLFGISWAAVATLLITFVLSWSGFISLSYKNHKARLASQNTGYDEQQYGQQPAQPQYATEGAQDLPATTDDGYAQQNQGTLGNEKGIKFFKIRRHNKEDAESV